MNEEMFHSAAKLAGFYQKQIEFMWLYLRSAINNHDERIDNLETLVPEVE